MDQQPKEYLEPDYSDHPREDDDEDVFVEEVDEAEVEMEKKIEEQEQLHEKIEREKQEYFKKKEEQFYMNSGNTTTPFGSSSGWSPSSGFGSTPEVKPWERNNQSRGSESSWRPSWGSGFSTQPSSPWSNNNEPRRDTVPSEQQIRNIKKKAIICDVLDCLYESWESNGCPNKMPRAVFDLMPKFQVWDRIASFAPQKIYLIFPAPELIPSFGSRQSNEITLEYIALSICTYLRIPIRSCSILKEMQEGLPKERTLMSAIKEWKNIEDIVYIGVHSGRFGLSSRDIDAAHQCGIDYIDMFNLLDGKYQYE